MSDIFKREKHIDPKYQHLEKYVYIAYKGFWTPAKYEKGIEKVDVPHYHNVLSPIDQKAIDRSILAVAMVEDKVKTFWTSISKDLPQTVISDIGCLLGQMETTHRRAYHALAEALKLDVDDIYNHQVIRDRVAYLSKHLDGDPKIIGKRRILKSLVLFTALVERGSLFTQFYILMSFAKANKGLKTISALQQTTATEELVHYSFGLDLINIIKEENPQLWSEYLVELVEKSLKEAYRVERDLIKWIFEAGVPDHLTEIEVVNFLNYNFSCIAKDLDVPLEFKYDEMIFEGENEWFVLKTMVPSEPDFFDSPVGGYSSTDDDYEDEIFEDD